MVTYYQGFKDLVHDSQQCSRAMLDAMAHPGCLQRIHATLEPPIGLTPAIAAACLTVLDLDVNIWLQPGWNESIRSWLMFHTGCRSVTDPSIANFALIHTWETAPCLADFHLGTPENPELSTTLFMQLPELLECVPVNSSISPCKCLYGPGIPSLQRIYSKLPRSFWEEWSSNHQIYPLGVDVLLFSYNHVMGLPRSVMARDC